DSGIGIAPEHQQQIFQIFGRVYSEKQYQGTGIGLSIVRKAAERMGGAVSLDSVPEKGSRFTVTLRKAQ
ncbi:MAG TPA: ATP-binding protein, partial [Verrucomicrobiae bacterium]|nr:ATP-binding protein [Verrucomicrobiae bacterium]